MGAPGEIAGPSLLASTNPWSGSRPTVVSDDSTLGSTSRSPGLNPEPSAIAGAPQPPHPRSLGLPSGTGDRTTVSASLVVSPRPSPRMPLLGQFNGGNLRSRKRSRDPLPATAISLAPMG